MSYEKRTIAVNITDPAADKKVPLLRVPSGHTYSLERVDVVPDTTVNASTADYWQCSLENGGTAGTGTTNIGGTAGGTPGWTANTPQQISIASGSGDLTEGQYLNLNYNEEGTVGPGRFTVIVEYVNGIGAKA